MRSFIIGLGFFVLSCTAVYCSQQQLDQLSRMKDEGERLIPPPSEHLDKMSFGYNEIMADSLWLLVIQNFDQCKIMGQLPSEIDPGLVPETPDNNLQSASFINPKSILEVERRGTCSRGYVFRMLDAITRLAPRYEIVYTLGAMALAVIVDDYEGATIILDRGVQNLPRHWGVAYRAAYNAIFNRRDLEKAAHYLVLSAENGGPPWLRSLASRLYSESGQIELALPLLMEARERAEGNALKDLNKRIYELKKRLAATKGGTDE